jgi:hypothetical protein
MSYKCKNSRSVPVYLLNPSGLKKPCKESKEHHGNLDY